jgi:hypothetical protein
MAKKRGNNERQTDRDSGVHAALPHVPAVQHVALYTRVSSEDQAERGTITTQRDFLRSFAQLYHLTIIEGYADDGVTGIMPLSERPEGRRLLQDASTGRFGCVLVYCRIADGSTLVAECRRLTVLGVPSSTRYRGGVIARMTTQWLPGRLRPLIPIPSPKMR